MRKHNNNTGGGIVALVRKGFSTLAEARATKWRVGRSLIAWCDANTNDEQTVTVMDWVEQNYRKVGKTKEATKQYCYEAVRYAQTYRTEAQAVANKTTKRSDAPNLMTSEQALIATMTEMLGKAKAQAIVDAADAKKKRVNKTRKGKAKRK